MPSGRGPGHAEPVVVEFPKSADRAIDLPLDEDQDVLEHALLRTQWFSSGWLDTQLVTDPVWAGAS